MATDYSAEIKDLKSISDLAIDLGKRLVIKDASVDAAKSIGQTELWIIQETAARLAADLVGYPPIMGEAAARLLADLESAPGKEGEDKEFSLVREQNKLFGRV
jgi:hypothetical protein